MHLRGRVLISNCLPPHFFSACYPSEECMCTVFGPIPSMPVHLEAFSTTNAWNTSVSDMTILVIATPVMVLSSMHVTATSKHRFIEQGRFVMVLSSGCI